MSKNLVKSVKNVQMAIDDTVLLLKGISSSRRGLTRNEKEEIDRVILELQDCSRQLPDLIRKSGGFGPVFKVIGKAIGLWRALFAK